MNINNPNEHKIYHHFTLHTSPSKIYQINIFGMELYPNWYCWYENMYTIWQYCVRAFTSRIRSKMQFTNLLQKTVLAGKESRADKLVRLKKEKWKIAQNLINKANRNGLFWGQVVSPQADWGWDSVDYVH
jgi:hypothetical protein